MTNVIAFTSGYSVPSARFRVRQYIPAMREYGVNVTEFPAHFGSYPPRNRIMRPFWGCASLVQRLPSILRSYKYDVTLLQRSFISTYTTLEMLTSRPRILDVDDAIFLARNVWHGSTLAKITDRVICGNAYLADWYSQWNKDVHVIPTGIDAFKYKPVDRPNNNSEKVIIGWIGTSGNLKYLYDIEDALLSILSQYPEAYIKVVSDVPPIFKKIDITRYKFEKWSEEREIKNIQEFDVGLMPLRDGNWEKGKCSFKMLQYMACGIPVVVSPVGMNSEILAKGKVGFGVTTHDQWVEAISALIVNVEERKEIGANGRKIVLDEYSSQVIAPRLARVMRY